MALATAQALTVVEYKPAALSGNMKCPCTFGDKNLQNRRREISAMKEGNEVVLFIRL
jgi:hypothetical protein